MNDSTVAARQNCKSISSLVGGFTLMMVSLTFTMVKLGLRLDVYHREHWSLRQTVLQQIEWYRHCMLRFGSILATSRHHNNNYFAAADFRVYFFEIKSQAVGEFSS